MILSNVNIGTGPSAGDGSPLRTAFTIINNNFQTIENNVNALTNSVNSVAGRTGNVILTVNDIVGLSNAYAISSATTTANTGMKGYVDQANTIQSAQIVTANIGMKGYVDSVASQSIYGNVNVKAYTETMGFQNFSNVNVSAYLAAQGITGGSYSNVNAVSLITGLGLSNYSNVNVKAYTETMGFQNFSNVNVAAYVTTANSAILGYIDLANTIQSAQVNAANLAIVAANLGMKGYVDSVASQSIYGNINVKAYAESMGYQNYGNVNVAAYVTTANSAIIGYIDLANTIQSQQISAANIGVIGYVDQANTIQSAQVGAANLAITAANVGMKGYVDSQSFYSNTKVATYLQAGNISNVSVAGNVTATYFLGNGALLTGLPSSYSNVSLQANLLSRDTIAIGSGAASNQEIYAVSLGYYAGQTGQRKESIAIGRSAGWQYQGANSVAIGATTGGEYQGNGAVAIGAGAGLGAQGANAVSIGSYINQTSPYFRGQQSQGNLAVSIGAFSGATNQGDNSVAIGAYAGKTNQPANSIIINASGSELNISSNVSGLYINPVRNDLANVANVVYYNSVTKEFTYAPAPNTGGGTNYSNVNVASYLGTGQITVANIKLAPSGNIVFADGTTQTTAASGSYSNVQVATYLPTYTGNIANIRIGTSGVLTFPDGTTQTTASAGGGSSYGNANVASYLPTYSGVVTASNVAVNGNVTAGNIYAGGIDTGTIKLTNSAVIKDTAGAAVSFGQSAGAISQGADAVAIGRSAGSVSQGNSAIAIGYNAGGDTQGIAAVAIGAAAGPINQANNSIIINATGSALDGTTANTFTVAPIRIDSGNVAQALYYNTTTKEITYANVTAGSYGNANVTAYTVSMGFTNFSNVNVAAYVTTANSAIIGYVDLANTIQSAQIGAANLAIIAANLGMKGYVDSVASQSIYGNGNVKSYLTQFDGNIIPSANVTYSLGNVTHRWKDLYISGNTIFLGDTTITTSGGAVLTPVTRQLFSQSFLPGSTNSAATFTLDRLPTAGSTRTVLVIGVQGGGPAPSYTLTEGVDFTISGLSLIITASYTATNISCTESYSDTGDLITVTEVATDTITPASGDLTVSGNVTVDGDLYVSPTSIYMGNLRISAADGNLKVNTGIKFSDDSVQSTAYSNVQVASYLSGNITVGNIAGSVNGYSIGYRDVPQITVANLTLIASDAGKHYYGANTNPTTITIPTNANVAFGNGTAISIVNQGTGNITVANAAGVLLYLAGNTTAGSRTLTSYGMATLIKVQVNTWFINGTGVV